MDREIKVNPSTMDFTPGNPLRVRKQYSCRNRCFHGISGSYQQNKPMIIWTGWGVLTILFAVIGMIAGGVIGSLTGALTGGVVGGGLAAFLNHIVAKALGGGKVVIDPATQQQILLKKSNSLFFIPMTWFTPILAVAGVAIGIMGTVAGQHDKEMDKKYPGKAVFEKADGLINSARGGAISHGNNPAAGKAAEGFCSLFKTMQSMSFEGDEKYASKDFLTYCHQSKDGVTFICQVPGMRKYKDEDTKKALSQIAWQCANIAAKDLPGFGEESTLTVGLRGISSYGSILQGAPGTESPTESDDKEILYKIFDPANAAVN